MVPSVPSVRDRLHGEYRAGKNRHDDPQSMATTSSSNRKKVCPKRFAAIGKRGPKQIRTHGKTAGDDFRRSLSPQEQTPYRARQVF